MAKYKALLVGAGGWGRLWAQNLSEHPDVTLASWVDAAPGLAAQSAATLNMDDVATGTDFATALAETKPDFVVDVSAHFAHHDIVTHALRYGVPVLGEKPMADSMDEARAMVAVSEQTGKLYMVSQSRRYDDRIYAFRTLINSALGGVELLDCGFYKRVNLGGYRLTIKNVLLLDMAIHTFDAARFITQSDAAWVYCESFNTSWETIDARNSALALFEMANGAHYTYRGSWSASGLETSWQSEWRAVGPKGSATWDGETPPLAEVVSAPDAAGKTTSELITATVETKIPFQIIGSLRDFLNALETGATPEGECHDNIKSLAMVFAAIESAETGQRVKVTA